MANALEQFIAEINRHFFLREYSFAKNQFRTLQGESELADHIIDLPDALFVFQLKERSADAPLDDKSLESWFKRKITDKGCGQIAASVQFFREHTKIGVVNQRGHRHEISLDDRLVIPVILYSSRAPLTAPISWTRHRVSKRAGFVHIMCLPDYYNVCRVLALPSELIAYFQFRQDLLLRNPLERFEEAHLTAMFIDETTERISEQKTRDILKAAYDDIVSFDIGSILRRFGDKVTYLQGSGANLDYYSILATFSRMSRAEMRGFKRLLTWALDNVGTSELHLPARMVSLSTGTGFVIFPVPKQGLDLRLNALNNFATLAKYDLKLARQIGVSIARDGEEVEIDWIFLEWPWRQDHELETALANNYPFRPIPAPKVEPRYRLG